MEKNYRYDRLKTRIVNGKLEWDTAHKHQTGCHFPTSSEVEIQKLEDKIIDLQIELLTTAYLSLKLMQSRA